MLSDVLCVVKSAAWIERRATSCDDLVGERDVCSNDEITRAHFCNNGVICYIKSTGNLHRLDESGFGHPNKLIGDERRLDLPAVGSTEDDLLHRIRTRVGIHPETQRLSRLSGLVIFGAGSNLCAVAGETRPV